MTLTQPTAHFPGSRAARPIGTRALYAALALELATIGVAALAFGPLDHQPTITMVAVALLFVGLLAPIGGGILAARSGRNLLSRRLGWLATLAALAQFAGLTWDTILHSLGRTHFFAAHTLAGVGFFGLLVVSLTYLLAEHRTRV